MAIRTVELHVQSLDYSNWWSVNPFWEVGHVDRERRGSVKDPTCPTARLSGDAIYSQSTEGDLDER